MTCIPDYFPLWSCKLISTPKKIPISEPPDALSAQETHSAKVIEKLKEWRDKNTLTHGQAAEIMARHGFPVSVHTLKSWHQAWQKIVEGGLSSKGKKGPQLPSKYAAAALENFINQHPKIENPPKHGRWVTPRSDIPAMRKMRDDGATLSMIGAKFRIHESTVSRILNGSRRA